MFVEVIDEVCVFVTEGVIGEETDIDGVCVFVEVIDGVCVFVTEGVFVEVTDDRVSTLVGDGVPGYDEGVA